MKPSITFKAWLAVNSNEVIKVVRVTHRRVTDRHQGVYESTPSTFFFFPYHTLHPFGPLLIPLWFLLILWSLLYLLDVLEPTYHPIIPPLHPVSLPNESQFIVT